ncbi:MAG TPA: hypothetical protein VGC93_00480 [Thermoanaerobaculia bacterium]
MRRRLVLALSPALVTLAVAASPAEPAPAAGRTLALVGGRLIDGYGGRPA